MLNEARIEVAPASASESLPGRSAARRPRAPPGTRGRATRACHVIRISHVHFAKCMTTWSPCRDRTQSTHHPATAHETRRRASAHPCLLTHARRSGGGSHMRVRAHGPSASVTVAILSSYELSANSPGWLAEASPRRHCLPSLCQVRSWWGSARRYDSASRTRRARRARRACADVRRPAARTTRGVARELARDSAARRAIP